MKILGVIPARYDSTRFPGKPLAKILDKPMIQCVYEQCSKAERLEDVIVATDDQRIFDAVNAFGGNVVMTSSEHKNGTERSNEAYSLLQAMYNENYDYVINIQGDEPLISPLQIDALCELVEETEPEIATMVRPFTTEEESSSENVVKCVTSLSGVALYFSRSVIPFARNERRIPIFQHVGIYAYHTDVLAEIVRLEPSPLEQAESLEQLRWLENDYVILAAYTEEPTYGVDMPEDIERIEELLKSRRSS